MIRIHDLTYTYPTAESPALSDISLEVPDGQLVAVVGATGAGKSTLCYTVSGFVPHFYRGTLAGTVHLDGEDLASSSLAQLAGKVGLVFANPFNQITGARFTVQEETAFGLENLGVPREEMQERIIGALALTGMTGLEDRSPYALSGGQQQRLAIASVVVMRPRFLVLDEPTSQLDPVGTREVFETLASLAKRGGTTVVIAEHKLEWIATYADRVIVLDRGRIVRDGEPRAVLTDERLDNFGLTPTRYTQVAWLASSHGLAKPGEAVPATLVQAVEYFGRRESVS